MMNNEEEEVSPETERVEIPEEEPAFRQSVLRNKRFLIVAFAVTAVVILAAFLFWHSRRGGEGQPVPAPRNTGFGQTNGTTRGR